GRIHHYAPTDTRVCQGKPTTRNLRQIRLLAVMAQCSCFVLAEYYADLFAQFILRLSNDDIDKGPSTFANEMTSSAMIPGLASSESLVLIDELGRATSPRNHFPCIRSSESLPSGLPSSPTLNTFQKSLRSSSKIGMTFTYKYFLASGR
ncbi:muts domain V-domain-containing protein, partial [Lactarius hatsudake]